jgi:four helix bundle protein
MANVAEGFERRRPADFYRYPEIAKASCAELRSHLYVALDAGSLDVSAFESVSAQAAEVGRLIGGLMTSGARRRDSEDSELGTRNSELS